MSHDKRDYAVDRRLLMVSAVALIIGGISTGAASLLLTLIRFFTNLFFYQRLSLGDASPAHHALGAWVILVPTLGGLLVGLIARYGSDKIRGHGIPEAMEAILFGKSRMSPKVALLKPLSSGIVIGSGGPFGAEGPIIMTGGAVGSILAQLLKLSADERKTLLVAGSAGGMAATFNAPLASILLAVELLLFEWRPRSFIPVATAVTVSTLLRGVLLGTGPVFGVLTPAAGPGPLASGLALVPGLTGGLLAIAATALVYLAEDGFARLPVHWMWWPALGGLIIGLGGLVEPRALGVGYDVIDQLLTGRATGTLIAGILVVKTLIWSLSLGSGTSGGVLAPVFMIGAALGAAEGALLPHVAPGFWAMCGLAAVVGGVMRSPLTGIVFTLELTHAWSDLLPLVVASVSAYALSVLLLKRSVLTEKIARRRLHLTREYSTDPLETFFTHEVMTKDPVVLRDAEQVAAVLPRIRPATLYPVVDGDDRLLGITTRRVLLESADATVAGAVVPAGTVVHQDDTLREVAGRLAAGRVTSAPVVDRADPDRVVGVITLAQLLHARRRDLHEEHYRERLLIKTRTTREEEAA